MGQLKMLRPSAPVTPRALPAGYTDSAAFCAELIERSGVICTPGAAFGPDGEGHVRFALVLPTEKIAEAIRAIDDCGILKK